MGLILDKINLASVEEYKREQEKRRNKYSGVNSASHPVTFPPNMASKCRREIVYHMLRLPVVLELEPQVLRIFSNGNDVHLRIQRLLAESGCLWKFEYPMHDEASRIKGYIDLIMKFSEEEYNLIDERDIPGRPYILGEIKSANSDKCYWMERKGELEESYVNQAQLYMHGTGIHKACIIVERKDDQHIFDYYIDYDQELVSSLLDKVNFCLNHADNKKLPNREGSRKSFPCWYAKKNKPMCNYYDICWSETEGYDLIMAGNTGEEVIELEEAQ
jgi:hypothetical protein